jgi:DNA repair protein RAD5
LDEAHLIKDRSTKTAKAAYGLNATNRWAVTGTPIINKLEYFELISDLFSLVHFLRVEPWCQFSFWNSFVTTPFSKRDPKALEVVQTILEPLIIRRTKDQKDSDGNPIVSLPSKTITIQRLTFSEEEQQLYDSMSNFSRKKLDYLKLIGKADYLHIFSLILRLRQLCDHKYLITASEKNESLFSKDLEELLKDHEGDQQFKDQVTTELQAKESKECPICFEDCYCGVLFPCLHSLCKSCLDDIMERTVDELECPICRKPCKETEIMQIVEPQTNTGKITLTSLDFKMSTKLHALVKEILRINCESPKEKMIVFSQWTSMLDICQVAFKENKISFVRLDGSLSQKDRYVTLI